jgi:hypothetical protein
LAFFARWRVLRIESDRARFFQISRFSPIFLGLGFVRFFVRFFPFFSVLFFRFFLAISCSVFSRFLGFSRSWFFLGFLGAGFLGRILSCNSKWAIPCGPRTKCRPKPFAKTIFKDAVANPECERRKLMHYAQCRTCTARRRLMRWTITHYSMHIQKSILPTFRFWSSSFASPILMVIVRRGRRPESCVPVTVVFFCRQCWIFLGIPV